MGDNTVCAIQYSLLVVCEDIKTTVKYDKERVFIGDIIQIYNPESSLKIARI